MSKRLAVIVINYRTPALVADCLASLDGQITPGVDEVVVVDNRSGDGSDALVEQTIASRRWHDWVRLIRSPVNGGFSAGNNVGIRAADAQAYLLLNSDTIVRPGAIASMLDALTRRPEAGLVSPRLLRGDGSLHVNCYRDLTPMTAMDYAARTTLVSSVFGLSETVLPVQDAPSEAEWTSFACVMVRRAVVDQIGLMDEGYFMYFEDQDYCRRARNAGWKVVNWPEAVVVHLQGGSGPVRALSSALKRRPRYYYAARSRYYAKYYTIAGLWAANVLWLAGRAVSMLREHFGRKQPHLCENEGIDNWTNWWRPMRQPEIPR